MKMNKLRSFGYCRALLALALTTAFLPLYATAQDYRPPQDQGYQDQGQGDDPPTRVARLGYMDGSVSFEPAGENDWVQAVSNRPMTTGDKLWADRGSRAELQLGSAAIHLSENTGISFLNLDDRTIQMQLSAGVINIRVRRLDRDDVFEIDTPNLAFTISEPGNYRLEASEDGTNTVVGIRAGDGQATGNGQTYAIHSGQRVTFSGTEALNADMEQLGGQDQFDSWADGRDRRYDDSRSAQYVSHDLVGYEDLDDYGDWRDDPNYGHVWYPNRVDSGWAPYHEGHWVWINPWGYTWVDDSPWGYAPFHYGRWVYAGNRWGWIAGPATVRPVYAPALVAFVGGGGGMGGNVAWFPLGPREVYVPSYPVSRTYVNQVNISNTTVTQTTITNVYNTTVINKTTVNNITYVNRNVQGAVTAVPQNAFASAQPVARNAVRVTPQQIASASVSQRVAVAPTQQSVLGLHAANSNHVSAPPAQVASRQVIAKTTPPPPPVPFAKQQQAMAAHPGQPLPKREMAALRPASTPATQPAVKVAPPGKPATPTTGHPPQPANQPANARPGQPANQPNQPGNARPGQPANQPNQPGNARPGQPAPNNQPRNSQPENRPGNQPTPNERPGTANQPQPNHPAQPPAAEPNRTEQPPVRNERPPAAQPAQPVPNNRPESNRPQPTQPQPNRQPQPVPNNRQNPPANQPQPNRQTEQPPRNDRPSAAQPNNRPEPSRPEQQNPERNSQPERPQTPPPAAGRPQQQEHPPQKQQTPEQKRREQEQQKPPGA